MPIDPKTVDGLEGLVEEIVVGFQALGLVPGWAVTMARTQARENVRRDPAGAVRAARLMHRALDKYREHVWRDQL